MQNSVYRLVITVSYGLSNVLGRSTLGFPWMMSRRVLCLSQVFLFSCFRVSFREYSFSWDPPLVSLPNVGLSCDVGPQYVLVFTSPFVT